MSEAMAPVIRVCPDGPLLVRGDVRILGEDGKPLAGLPASVALCRCGTSQLKPLCDGTHKVVRHRDEGEPS